MNVRAYIALAALIAAQTASAQDGTAPGTQAAAANPAPVRAAPKAEIIYVDQASGPAIYSYPTRGGDRR
ncbi:hypothetical protein [Methylomagnum ishizawai]|uniref:hypothetical protein n=1 Tax=Methylomagnum ishizawai TaxID=1760988 RepID=UPI001C32BFD4|nr:hypothetical protein [Methylomagnum ishizawai]BBL77387.1 hypothetical protein MishRS11D_44850 [Methylomagnum ishizawai]